VLSCTQHPPDPTRGPANTRGNAIVINWLREKAGRTSRTGHPSADTPIIIRKGKKERSNKESQRENRNTHADETPSLRRDRRRRGAAAAAEDLLLHPRADPHDAAPLLIHRVLGLLGAGGQLLRILHRARVGSDGHLALVLLQVGEALGAGVLEGELPEVDAGLLGHRVEAVLLGWGWGGGVREGVCEREVVREEGCARLCDRLQAAAACLEQRGWASRVAVREMSGLHLPHCHCAPLPTPDAPETHSPSPPTPNQPHTPPHAPAHTQQHTQHTPSRSS